jgi:protease IV
MVFARKVWKLLVGIKDGLALLFLLLFFMLLYALLTLRPGPGAVREGALLLELDGVIVEEPAVIDPLGSLISMSAPTTEYRARDLVRAIETAATDERIKVVVLDLSQFLGGGLVNLQEVGDALDKVRAANKPVLAYGLAMADDGILLASHATEVWVDPLGATLAVGPGGQQMYYAALLERLKVDVHIYRVGTFKDAVEPFMRTSMSEESRAALTGVLNSVWETWKADVTKARPQANLALATTNPAQWAAASNGDLAAASKAAGLVDRIGNRVQFGARVAEIAGKDSYDPRPGRFAYTPLRAWLAENEPETPGKAIAVVTVAGEIVDGEAGPGTAGGDRIAELIDEAVADKVPALVLRIDSPGGSVLASEVIRSALDRARAKKIPVVASMGNYAASGGYWVATPAQRIFAEPGTITGSIWVFAVIPTFERALASVGVSTDGVRTTPLSGQPDLLGGFTPEADALLQMQVEHYYGRFLSLVGKSRGKPPEAIDAVAQGRVWDGGTARQLGLVDQFGGLDDALAHAATLAKLESGGWHPRYYGQETNPYASIIEQLIGDEDSAPPARSGDLAGLIADRQQSLVARALSDVDRMIGVRGIQAYCGECPLPLARAPKLDAGLLARVAGWLERVCS